MVNVDNTLGKEAFSLKSVGERRPDRCEIDRNETSLKKETRRFSHAHDETC